MSTHALTLIDSNSRHIRKDSMDPHNMQTAGPTRPNFEPIIEQSPAEDHAHESIKFDPKTHLSYEGPVNTFTMESLGLPEDLGVSPIAVSEPFKLFSAEAVEQMRAEVFNPEVMKSCGVSSNIAACQIRGWAKKYGPFTYEAWNHPDTLDIVSKLAGVDLVPQFDYEIAHINFSVKSDVQTKEELDTIHMQKRLHADDEGIGGCPWGDDKPVVGWHRDSYPFVVVLMLSDCKDMVGGETALRCANGDIRKVRGPEQGSAVLLQGRYITHQALRALGSKERITAVTSFRPRSAMLKDDSVLTTIRPVSDLSELYYDFADYRLEIMEKRIRKAREEMTARRKNNQKFDTLGHKHFLEESIAFLEHSNSEIVEDHKVIAGQIEEMNIPDVVVGAQEESPQKRPRHK